MEPLRRGFDSEVPLYLSQKVSLYQSIVIYAAIVMKKEHLSVCIVTNIIVITITAKNPASVLHNFK